MSTASESDEELPLNLTDVPDNPLPDDFLPTTIGAQATDIVKSLLAQARHRDDNIEPFSEQQSFLSETELSEDWASPSVKSEGFSGSAEFVDWQQHRLHVFVLSDAGKPVYSRHGDESHLASIMGVMQALVSFVAAAGDELQSIEADDRTFVFLCKPPLILVAVGQPMECRAHLLVCLNYVYNQILSLLTLKRLKQRFELQQNLDLRRLLSGDSRLISSIVDFTQDAPGAFLQAVSYIPMSVANRDQVAQIIFQSVKSPTLVFGMLAHRHHLVALVCMKGHTLLPLDLHLIMNMISSSEQLKSGQTHWLPICLPQFDANGFMYAHISFLDEATSLILLSVDSTEFYALDEAKNKIFQRLKSAQNGELLRSIWSAEFPTISSIGAPEVRHMVCKLVPVSQYVSTEWAVPYSTSLPTDLPSDQCIYPLERFTSGADESRHEILSTYRRLHARLHNPDYPTRFVFQSTPTEGFAAWRIDAFEFYITLEPLTTKITLNVLRKTLLRWIQSRKTHLFALSTPNF